MRIACLCFTCTSLGLLLPLQQKLEYLVASVAICLYRLVQLRK